MERGESEGRSKAVSVKGKGLFYSMHCDRYPAEGPTVDQIQKNTWNRNGQKSVSRSNQARYFNTRPAQKLTRAQTNHLNHVLVSTECNLVQAIPKPRALEANQLLCTVPKNGKHFLWPSTDITSFRFIQTAFVFQRHLKYRVIPEKNGIYHQWTFSKLIIVQNMSD